MAYSPRYQPLSSHWIGDTVAWLRVHTLHLSPSAYVARGQLSFKLGYTNISSSIISNPLTSPLKCHATTAACCPSWNYQLPFFSVTPLHRISWSPFDPLNKSSTRSAGRHNSGADMWLWICMRPYLHWLDVFWSTVWEGINDHALLGKPGKLLLEIRHKIWVGNGGSEWWVVYRSVFVHSHPRGRKGMVHINHLTRPWEYVYIYMTFYVGCT